MCIRLLKAHCSLWIKSQHDHHDWTYLQSHTCCQGCSPEDPPYLKILYSTLRSLNFIRIRDCGENVSQVISTWAHVCGIQAGSCTGRSLTQQSNIGISENKKYFLKNPLIVLICMCLSLSVVHFDHPFPLSSKCWKQSVTKDALAQLVFCWQKDKHMCTECHTEEDRG